MSGQGFSRPWLLLLCIAFTAIWFGTLDYRKLIKPDEGRYAEIAREMAASGDWVTPRLNGIKYFEKPPLQYWMTAAAFRAFGENEWTARLWSGVTGFLGVLLVAFTGARLFGPSAGILSGIVLGSSLWWVIIGHFNALDMGFAFFLEVAMAGFLLAQAAAERTAAERAWMLAAWAGMALAVLSKGLAGLVLPGLALACHCLLARDLSPLRRMHWRAGALVALLVAAPWFIAVSMRNPEFPHFFFIHEHFNRYLTTEHGRYRPGWYFIPVLLLGAMPWTAVAAHGAISVWRARATGAFDAGRFLVVWAAAIFVFFSMSSSKLASYILPLFPALALLAGDLLSRQLATRGSRALHWHFACMGLAAVAALAYMSSQSAGAGRVPLDPAAWRYVQWLIVGAALLAVGCLLALWQNRRGRAPAGLGALGVSALLAAVIALLGHESLGRLNSSHDIAARIRPLLKPDTPLYSVDNYDQTLPFYLGRTVTLVDYRDEFAFGLAQEPWLSVPGIAEFRSKWESDAQPFAVMTPERYDLMRGAGLPMEVVARDSRRVIVRRP